MIKYTEQEHKPNKMSAEIDSITRSGTPIHEEKIPSTAQYRRLIIEKAVQFVGLFYLVYGVFIAYVWTSMELDVKSRNDIVKYYFWDPAIATFSLANLTVFLMIILNKYWSHKAHERSMIHKPDNFVIVCVMVIPLFVASSIFNILELVRDFVIIPCHGYTTVLVPLSTLALTSGAAILIFDVGYFTSTSKSWVKELMKCHIVFFTVIGITNCLVITVAMQHMNIFRQESFNSSYGDRFRSNESCIQKNNVSISLDTAFKASDKYLRPTYILFCVCTLAYLIQPMTRQRSRQGLGKTDSTVTTDTDDASLSDDISLLEKVNSILEVKEEQRVSYRLPSVSLVLCIIILSLSFLSFIIMYSLRQNSMLGRHSHLGSLIFCSFISIVYGIGSGLSASHIIEIKRWPISPHMSGKIIDKCLIWIGAGGQLGLTITSICNAIVLLVKSDREGVLLGLLYMIIFSNLALVVQTFLQTIQVSLLLDRKWLRPEIKSMAESLCPAVGMMGLNMGLLILSIDQLKSPTLSDLTTVMFVDLFTRELRCVGETLCILQRLHASLLFASMIVYTHN